MLNIRCNNNKTCSGKEPLTCSTKTAWGVLLNFHYIMRVIAYAGRHPDACHYPVQGTGGIFLSSPATPTHFLVVSCTVPQYAESTHSM